MTTKENYHFYTEKDCVRLFRSLIRRIGKMPKDTPLSFYNTLYINFNPISEVMRAMILIGSVNASENEQGKALLKELQNLNIRSN